MLALRLIYGLVFFQLSAAWSPASTKSNSNEAKKILRISSLNRLNGGDLRKFPRFSLHSLANNDSTDNAVDGRLSLVVQYLDFGKMIRNARKGYMQRLDADPLFLSKSILEVFIATSTQLFAEISVRGKMLIPEIDFVIAGILTAIAGKYYSMWQVARTIDNEKTKLKEEGSVFQDNSTAASNLFWKDVPTNAFQSCSPSLLHSAASFVRPIPSLFKAGLLASFFGYGLTSVLIKLRSLALPNYVAATVPPNIVYVSLYTGVYLATSSNIRYQLLQGIIEPVVIDSWILLGKSKRYKVFRTLLIFTARLLNGLLGSNLAILGMKLCGLQKLK
mmetsp:Transcript_6767/g.10280  ORF Transcript_6767/g.10280 Transcript_6767/m.10280 type:complete len:332 (-) Transcript_6767:11-1006(-)